MKQYLTKQQIAERLNVDPRTIQRMVAARQIPYVRLRNQVLRFDPEKVENHLLKSEVKPITL